MTTPPDPWEEIPVSLTVTIPHWMVEYARVEYDEPNWTAEDLVHMWIENMQENTYDIARDEGHLPVPPLEGS